MKPLEYLRSAYEIFEERQRVRKLKIYFIAGVLLVSWSVLVVIVLKTPKMEQHVHVSAPAVTPSSNPAHSGTGNVVAPVMRPSMMTRRHITVQTPISTSYSSHQEGGGYTMKLHTTSSAVPVFIGGGGGGGVGSTGGSSSNANSSQISYGSYPAVMALRMPSTSALIETSQSRLERHNLTADNTIASIQGVIESNGPRGTLARAKKDGWDDYGQDDEPFLDPVGDVTWGLMVLLTIGWCVRVRLKRQRACK